MEASKFIEILTFTEQNQSMLTPPGKLPQICHTLPRHAIFNKNPTFQFKKSNILNLNSQKKN